MCRSVERTIALLALLLALPVSAQQPWSTFGRPATPAEIAAWDIDVRPDGKGLPKGRGSVVQGRDVYDVKCATCHGEFGENNQFLQIAGGIGSLASDQPVRTTGSKLNHATTLWDYINRSMPFQAPKSLTADEVYALTAYVLHLNDILPEDTVLDERSILTVQMPNRDGYTTRHGFMTRDGTPDVHSLRCLHDCEPEVRISSSLPPYARNAHGNLADQFRAIGPVRGANTAGAPPAGAASPPAGR